MHAAYTGGTKTPDPLWCVVGPVSYTHLDVYKRQESLGACGSAAFLAMGSLLAAGRKLNLSAHTVRRVLTIDVYKRQASRPVSKTVFPRIRPFLRRYWNSSIRPVSYTHRGIPAHSLGVAIPGAAVLDPQAGEGSLAVPVIPYEHAVVMLGVLIQQSCGNKTPNNLGRNLSLIHIWTHNTWRHRCQNC